MTNEQQSKRDDALADIKLYQASGWEVKEETGAYFLLTRNTSTVAGHLLVFIIFWWTLGIANVLYHLFNKETKKIVK